MEDKESAFSICAYFEKDKCSAISVVNNIGAASSVSGFAMGVGYNCGEEATQKVFRNNVAHSNYGNRDGDGAIIVFDANLPSS